MVCSDNTLTTDQRQVFYGVKLRKNFKAIYEMLKAVSEYNG